MRLIATNTSIPGLDWLGSVLLWLITLQFSIRPVTAQSSTELNGNITYTNANGTIIYLQDDRKPSLYTADFGTCQDDGVFNITRFEAAFYRDNMTVAFHLEGNTSIPNDYASVSLTFFIYGATRYSLVFNPCGAGVNIPSLCPLLSTNYIDATGVVQVTEQDIDTIPSIAFNLPDVEGQAILQIFSNSTQSQVACLAAAMKNGATFSQPAAVGTILGIFSIIAIIAVFAAVLCGVDASTLRNSYAQSLSVCVVFAVLQQIFFTGALSVNWPSLLVSFWSNYAWSAGMIFTTSMQASIGKFIGTAVGNPSEIGAANTGNSTGFDRGASLTTIFPRFGTNYTGGPAVRQGLPLPGNFSGFAGTLAVEGIPLSNAFMTGFLWFLILLLVVILSISISKCIMEVVARFGLMRNGRFNYFRANWKNFILSAVLRTFFISFFMLMFLCLFQFVYASSPGAKGLAVVVFLIVFVGMLSLAGYACFYVIKTGKYIIQTRDEDAAEDSSRQITHRFFTMRLVRNDANDVSIHNDEDFLIKFGWLSARFHLDRFWFFAAWVLYNFLRVSFLAGAITHPLTQIFGLLVIEILGLVALIMLKPFRGNRLNFVMVLALSICNILTLALSAAFEPRFNVNRVTCASIGVAIIVIQTLLSIALVAAIVAGAYISYGLCRRRNQPVVEVRPTKKPMVPYPVKQPSRAVEKRRESIKHPKSTSTLECEKPAESYFKVNSVARMSKIEDEDEEFGSEIGSEGIGLRSTSELSLSNLSRTQLRSSRRMSGNGRPCSIRSSVSYSNLPYGARPHRASWSSKDFDPTQDLDLTRMPLPKPPRFGGTVLTSPSSSATSLGVTPSNLRKDTPLPKKTDPSPLRNSSADLGSFNFSHPG